MTTNREWLFSKPWEEQLAWLDAERVAVSAKPLKMPTDGEWNAEVGAPKPQNSQSDAPKSEKTDEIGASKREMRDFDDEHAEGRFTEVGRTSASGMDSREKLMDEIAMFAGSRRQLIEMMQAWLDRQAAITRAELVDCANCPITERNAKVIAELREQLDETKRANCSDSREQLEFEANNLQLHALAGEQAATIDELQASLDSAKRAIAKAGGTWTEHEDGTVAVVFAPDVDKLKANLEAARAKNRALKAHITQMQQGRHGWHVKAKDLEAKMDSLRAERDEWKAKAGELQQKLDWEEWPDGGEINLERAWMNHMRTIEQLQGRVKELTVERDQLKEQHGRQAETIGRLQEHNGELQERVDDLEDERDAWRAKCGELLDIAHEMERVGCA